MAVPQGFQKAQLQIEGGDTIQCAFNPRELHDLQDQRLDLQADPGQGLARRRVRRRPADDLQAVAAARRLARTAPTQSIKDQANKLMEAMHGNGSAPKFVDLQLGLGEAAEGGAALDLDPLRAVPVPTASRSGRSSTSSWRRPRHSTPPGQAQNPTTRGHRRPAVAHRPRRRLAAVDRLRGLRRRHPLAGDRRGQRDRRSAAPAARPAADDSEARRMSATTETARRALLDPRRRGRDRRRAQPADPRGPGPELPAAARHVHVHRGRSRRASRARTEPIDQHPFDIGKKLEIRLGRARGADHDDAVQGRDRHARAELRRRAASSCWCAASTARTC